MQARRKQQNPFIKSVSYRNNQIGYFLGYILGGKKMVCENYETCGAYAKIDNGVETNNITSFYCNGCYPNAKAVAIQKADILSNAGVIKLKI